MLPLVLVLALAGLVSSTCVKSHHFSACSEKNKRDLIVTASGNCETDYPVFYPQLDCDFECPAGYFLDVVDSKQACSPCPEGTFSIGGGMIFGKEGTGWQAGLDSLILACSSRQNNTFYMNFACNSWQVEDGMLVTNQSTQDLPYKAILTFFFEIVKAGNILIRYKKETIEAQNKNIGELLIMKNMQAVYIDSSSNKNHWKTVKIDLNPGFNEVIIEYKTEKVNEIWPKAFISSVFIQGVRFADEKCLPCSQGGSKKAASFCEVCDFNEYWDEGGCLACPEGTFAYRGAKNVSACLPRGPCSHLDYKAVTSPCMNGLMTQTFEWKQPTFCDTSSFSLPPAVSSLPCPPCSPGFFQSTSSSGVSSCEPCPEKQFFNTSSNYCQACPDGQVPEKILNITHWEDLPSFFQTSCIRSDGSPCIHSYGWVPSSGFISTGHLVHNNSELVLSINLFVESKAQVSVELEIINKTSGRLETLANGKEVGFINSQGKQVKTFEISSGWQLIQWIFHSSLHEEVRIYSVAVKGSQAGVAVSCSSCESGFIAVDSRCESCPAGSTSDDFHKTCIKCGPEHFSLRPGSKCFECPEGSHPDPERKYCLGSDLFTAENRTFYIGNLTGRSPGFLCDLPTSQFYCLDSFYGPLASDNQDFFLSILNPGNLSLKFADFQLAPVPGYAFAVNYNSEVPDLSSKSASKCRKAGKIVNIGSSVANISLVTEGFTIEYSDGDVCDAGLRWKSAVQMVCDKSVAVGWPAFQTTSNCEVLFVWKSRFACPVCDNQNITVHEGGCFQGKRKIRAVEANDCVLPLGQKREWVETCETGSKQLWVEVGIGLAALVLFIVVGVLGLMIFQYKQKYIKLKEVSVVPLKAIHIPTD